MLTEGFSLPQMVEDLRKYQLELEVQNKALRYSQQVAEGASERFLTLFSNVPLALMVVDEHGLVLESNAMALRLFRPMEQDPPLNFLLPLVDPGHSDAVAQAFLAAKQHGTSEITDAVCRGGSASTDMAPPVPLRLQVEIRSDGFALSTGNAAPQEIDLRDGGLDHAALAVMARKLKVTHPDEVSVTVTAENDVPMAKLVETLDTLRGEGCKLGGLARGEAPGPACLFDTAIIEA